MTPPADTKHTHTHIADIILFQKSLTKLTKMYIYADLLHVDTYVSESACSTDSVIPRDSPDPHLQLLA